MNKEEVYSHLRFLGWRIETDEVGDKYAIRLEQELEAGHLICLSMVFHMMSTLQHLRTQTELFRRLRRRTIKHLALY